MRIYEIRSEYRNGDIVTGSLDTVVIQNPEGELQMWWKTPELFEPSSTLNAFGTAKTEQHFIRVFQRIHTYICELPGCHVGILDPPSTNRTELRDLLRTRS
jgi:hypothetical protein